ncbi:hypothetical protein MXB_2387 [Myxobolus squamalis]|nr:hypothetical protein MXB_2387 [Myxobolus squamalis]
MDNFYIVSIFSVITLFGEIGQIVWLPLWLDSTQSNRTISYDRDPGTYAIIIIICFNNFIVFAIATEIRL